jgi:hypothetical protein
MRVRHRFAPEWVSDPHCWGVTLISEAVRGHECAFRRRLFEMAHHIR